MINLYAYVVMRQFIVINCDVNSRGRYFNLQKQTTILKRAHSSKDSSKYYRSRINNLKAEIAHKQNELDSVLNVYNGLGKA